MQHFLSKESGRLSINFMRNNFRWSLAGCKPQSVRVLETLYLQGYVPEKVFILKELQQADVESMRSITQLIGAELIISDTLKQHTDYLKTLDLLLVCRFNLLCPQVFSAPRLGSVNIHSSLLPQYRGVHPVSWALVNGEQNTGVTLHCIDRGIDTGDVLLQEQIAISSLHNIQTLTDDLNQISAKLAVELFDFIHQNNALPCIKKPMSSPSYARRRTPEDSHINWGNSQSIPNLIRALMPFYSPPYSYLPNNQPVNIYSAVLTQKNFLNDKRPGYIIQKNADASYLINASPILVEITTDKELPLGECLI